MSLKPRLLVGFLAATASCAAAPFAEGIGGRSLTQIANRSINDQACGLVSNAQSRGAQTVAPSMALDCLNSVPLDVERDAALVD